MSTPTRPRFTPPANRPSKLGETMGCLFRIAFLVAVLGGVFYLIGIPSMNQRNVLPPVQPVPNAATTTDRPVAKNIPPQQVPPLTGEPSAAQPAAGADKAQNIELATAGSIQRQQLAAGKFKQHQVIAIYEELKRVLDEWEN